MTRIEKTSGLQTFATPQHETGDRFNHVRHALVVVLKDLEAIYGAPDDATLESAMNGTGLTFR